MGWSSLTLTSDADIGALEPEAIASGSPWGAATWASPRAEAKRDLKIWIETDFVDVPGAPDRILDRWSPDYLFTYTGSAYTDRTTEARDDTEKDINLAAALATIGTDRIYVGAPMEFDGLFVKLLDSLNSVASVLTAKYWGGTGWISLTATDGTAVTGKTFAQSGRITWTLPADWERRRLNGTGDEYFWVELSISVALTTGTAATQILPIRAPDALKRVATYLALYHILNGLAQAAVNPEVWQKKADVYWERAVGLYAAIKANRALWLDINNTGSIEPPVETQQGKAGITLGRG